MRGIYPALLRWVRRTTLRESPSRAVGRWGSPFFALTVFLRYLSCREHSLKHLEVVFKVGGRDVNPEPTSGTRPLVFERGEFDFSDCSAGGYPHHRCQSALSVPTPKMSKRLAAQATASTRARSSPESTLPSCASRTPPRDSQPPQDEPFHHRCQSALFVPITKMSSRFADQETAFGGDSSTPPRDCQPPHDEPSHQRCQSALSVPTAKMSSRPSSQETTSGCDVSVPPKDSHPPQDEPPHQRCHRA